MVDKFKARQRIDCWKLVVKFSFNPYDTVEFSEQEAEKYWIAYSAFTLERNKIMNGNLTGEKLLKTAVNQILAHPETWDQSNWHSPCGTKHCIAGWCQILAGKPANDDTAKEDAMEALGLNEEEANTLFRASTSLPEIYYFATHFNETGYDRDGYDRAGFDKYGYNRDGYNRDGFNRDGFDRDGFDKYDYNRNGFNRDGFDRDGYNRGGYNREGYNRDGFDRDGYNRDGYDRDGYNRTGYGRDGFNRDGKKLQPFEV
jgi:hypothetical protein